MKSKVMAVILIFLLFSVSCSEEKQNIQNIKEVAEHALDAEQTTVVERGDVENCIWMPGYVAPKVHQLKFEEQGIFEEYKVKIGEEVTKGQVLATISNLQVENQIEEFEKALAELASDYEYQTIYIDKTIAAYKKEMDGYYAKLKDEKNPLVGEAYSQVCMELGVREVAIKDEELKKAQLKETYDLESSYLRSKIKTAKAKADRYSILSPCDGVVIALQDMSKETYTQEGYYYVAIAEKDVYYLRCAYMGTTYVESMKKILGFRNGKEYDITHIPMDGKTYMEQKNGGEAMFTHFEITAPDADIAYGSDMLVKLVISERKDVLKIPYIALEDGDETSWFVYRKTPEGKEKVYVQLGLTDANRINTEVLSGLEEGDVIYVQK